MKHEFKDGDGMSKETSTPKERKEIHHLLEDNGYKVLAKTKTRDECAFKRNLFFEYSVFHFLHEVKVTNDYTYQEMKDFILGKEETITVTRSELYEAFRALRVGIYYSTHDEARVEAIFEGVKELQSKLPTIELKGANKEIKYVSMDSSDPQVYGYKNRPGSISTGWSDGKSCIPLDGLEQYHFESIKAMDWKESLHKVKHI